MYYTSNEVEVVNDIVDKWDTFHPTVNSALHPDFSAGRHSFRCP
jgi:hypothetical protein